MATFDRGAVSLHYEERGTGYPLLLFAPGGMHSRLAFWGERPDDWFDPLVELSDEFRVIGMDQRNAGHSRAPVTADDGWHTYVSDAIALLDHLGIADVAVMGGCIGASFALGLCAAWRGSIGAAVLQNPIGASADGHDHFLAMCDKWVDELRTTRPDVEAVALSWAAGEPLRRRFRFQRVAGLRAAVHRADARAAGTRRIPSRDDRFGDRAVGAERRAGPALATEGDRTQGDGRARPRLPAITSARDPLNGVWIGSRMFEMRRAR